MNVAELWPPATEGEAGVNVQVLPDAVSDKVVLTLAAGVRLIVTVPDVAPLETAASPLSETCRTSNPALVAVADPSTASAAPLIVTPLPALVHR